MNTNPGNSDAFDAKNSEATPPGKGKAASAEAPALLTTPQCANLLGLSTSSLHRLRSSGGIGPLPIKLGSAVRWPRAQILDWIAKGCPPAAVWRAAPAPVRFAVPLLPPRNPWSFKR